MTSLIAPHGGLTEPVCRTVAAEALDDFLAHAKTLPQVPVSDADLSTVYRLGDGGLSPLTGPMDSATYNRVLDEVGDRARRQALRLDDSRWRCRSPRTGRPSCSAGPEGGAGQLGRARSSATLEISDVYPVGQAEVPAAASI